MEHEEIVEEVVEEEMVIEDEAEQVPSDEWTVAALAHATVLLTLVLGVAGGIGALIGPAVALAMYFGYRERSRFAAFHALQSCAYQVAGVLLYLVFTAVMVVWLVIAWTISGVLSAVLVGFLMMPFALLMTLLVVLLLICIPFAWLGYGLYASYQVYQGRDFHYRWIGEWVKREVKF
jgi:uncharacterized Tic20 family protein